jgi:uncharacterized HAD superfamily protein
MMLGIDLDGTIANWLGQVVRQHNREFGTRLRESDITMWDFLHLTQFSNWPTLLRWAVERECYLKAEGYPLATRALRWLAQEGGHQIMYLTHRPWAAEKQTATWLARRGLFYGGVSFTSDKTTWSGIDLWIDDAPHIATRLVEKGQRVLLMDRPWNQEVQQGPLLRRVFTWRQVPAFVEAGLPK